MNGISVTQNSNSVVILIDRTAVKPEKINEILKVAETEITKAKIELKNRTWLDGLVMIPFVVKESETFSRDEIYGDFESDAPSGNGAE